MACEIEARWQNRWEADGTFNAPNPAGPLAGGFDRMAGRPKFMIMDMFPYPSGAGLHVGHPLGYIATDVYARYLRMTGHNVLHPFGYDAFGLPAEQYAIDTGQHPAVTTETQHRHDATPAAATGPRARPAAGARDHRSRLLQMDAVDLLADLQQLVRRPGRAGLGRSPTWSRSSPPASVSRWATPTRTACPGTELSPARAPGGRRRLPAGLHRHRARQLVPRARHRAGQRGGHCRRTQRHRQLPGVPAAIAAVDAADLRLCAAPDRRPGPGRLARVDQDHAAQLDRRQ